MTLRIGSLCSGYEGIGLAVMDVLGGEMTWVADIDPGACKTLAHRFPSAPNLGDITTVDWAAVELVDVLCAGFPCQDISCAGARAGLRRGTRSGLWHEVASAIGVLRPRIVVIENVRELLTARGDDPTAEHLAAEASRDACTRLLEWLDTEQNVARKKGSRERAQKCSARTVRVMELRKRAVARCRRHERRLVRAIGTVLGSLADLGYDTRWVTVSASDAGAPHKRARVFITAWPAADPDGQSVQRQRVPGILGSPQQAAAGVLVEPEAPERERQRDGHAAADRDQPTTEDPDRATGGERRLAAPGQAEGGRSRADAGGPGGAPDADASGIGQPPGTRDGDGRSPAIGSEALKRAGDRSNAPADSDSGGLPEREERDSGPLTGVNGASGVDPLRRVLDWGAYGPAIHRWEAVTGRPAPWPTEPGRTGERLSPRFVEWMQGLSAGWVTDVPGLSRNAQLHALGNGVVPAQAAMALRLLLGALEAGESA